MEGKTAEDTSSGPTPEEKEAFLTRSLNGDNRKGRRNTHKVIKTRYESKFVTCDIGKGQVKGGRATRWAIRCSNCGWLDQTFTSKVSAARAAHGHVEGHKGNR